MVDFKEDERLNTLNHSCAHVMAQAVKHLYPNAKFWVGPVVKEGFYYDIDLGDTAVNDDVIAAIEKEIAEADSANGGSSESDESISLFQDFTGKDLDGNDVDESFFKNNKVTVVNFWFSGCKPCVEELSKLNELNETLKTMGGEVVGINTDTLDNNQDGIKEAQDILKAQGASYKNLTVASDSAIGKYASSIMAFPTTVLVDKDGNIVGEPLMGGIDDQANYDQLMEQIQAVINQ